MAPQGCARAALLHSGLEVPRPKTGKSCQLPAVPGVATRTGNGKVGAARASNPAAKWRLLQTFRALGGENKRVDSTETKVPNLDKQFSHEATGSQMAGTALALAAA